MEMLCSPSFRPSLVLPIKKRKDLYQYIFSHSNNLGKVERLLWFAGQARKVHSSACNDALWCLKYSSAGKPRGANPLACNICLDAVRNCCPAHEQIKHSTITFNDSSLMGNFNIETDSKDNTTPNQKFVLCTGDSIYGQISDDFSPYDNPGGFAPFPVQNHKGDPITVEDFIKIY